jgi:FtsP/CotA-like multicopper oxidase with cupredoxin domain
VRAQVEGSDHDTRSDQRENDIYMYHCHILEHEDRDMMRPFVTMPPELMPFMA